MLAPSILPVGRRYVATRHECGQDLKGGSHPQGLKFDPDWLNTRGMLAEDDRGRSVLPNRSVLPFDWLMQGLTRMSRASLATCERYVRLSSLPASRDSQALVRSASAIAHKA